MGHTAPDWSWMGRLATVYPLGDLGEHAVRVGSILTFDRRGNVMFLDSFENGLAAWEESPVGPGSRVDLSVAYARNGAHSCRLLLGPAGARSASLVWSGNYRKLGRIGLEVSFAFPALQDTLNIYWAKCEGTDWQLAYARISPSIDTLAYRVGGVGYVDLNDNLGLTVDPYIFHTVKIVMDVEADEYVRILMNDREYSVGGQPLFPWVGPVYNALLLYIEYISPAAAGQAVYIDDVIITQNEP